MSDVKHRWNDRMERAERRWVVFCVSGTLILAIIELATGNL